MRIGKPGFEGGEQTVREVRAAFGLGPTIIAGSPMVLVTRPLTPGALTLPLPNDASLDGAVLHVQGLYVGSFVAFAKTWNPRAHVGRNVRDCR